MEYVPLYRPADQAESAFIESLLKAGGVRYFIHGELSTTILAGYLFNQRHFYVHPDDLRTARELLRKPDNLVRLEKGPLTKPEPGPAQSPQEDEGSSRFWSVAFFILLGVFILFAISRHYQG